MSSFNVTMDVTMEMRGTFLRTARKNIMDFSRENLEIKEDPHLYDDFTSCRQTCRQVLLETFNFIFTFIYIRNVRRRQC